VKINIQGSCAHGFEKVSTAFERNFVENGEVGAAVAVWVEGELVVNLWGGWADAAGTKPWREDTLAAVYSGTKGLTSTCVHLLADRGEIDLDAPVAAYWPEFGQAGKSSTTVRQLLSHQSGAISVPGALEIPTAVAIALDAAARRRRAYDGVVALGCVIRGETIHFEIVSQLSAGELMDLSVSRKIPIGNGIITVENEAQAKARASVDDQDKGGGAVRAALTLVGLKKRLGKR